MVTCGKLAEGQKDITATAQAFHLTGRADGWDGVGARERGGGRAGGGWGSKAKRWGVVTDQHTF